MIRKAIVISDLHCGSTYGLMPPEVVMQEEHKVRQSKLQEWLWQCWQDWQGKWWDKHIGDDPVALIINGDAVEGIHHRTMEVVSPDPADHRNIARHVLHPLAERCEHVFVVEGTECHTGNQEHKLAVELGAVTPDSEVRAAWGALHIEIHGCPCMFVHHVGATSRVYLEASQLSIAMRNHQLDAINADQKPPKVVGFAHRHKFGSYRAHDALSFVTPPWQAVTRHGRRVVPGARCVPGVVLLDWSDKEHGELPELHSMTYKPRPQEVVKI